MMNNEMMMMGKEKSKTKKMMHDDMNQYDETYHWSKAKKDKNTYFYFDVHE